MPAVPAPPANAASQKRAAVVLFATTAYAVAAALRAQNFLLRSGADAGESPFAPRSGAGRPWAFALLAFVLAFVALRRRGLLRVASWGLALSVATLGASVSDGWVDLVGIVGATMASLAARSAMEQVPAPTCLGALPSPSPVPALVLVAATSALAAGSELAVSFHVAPGFAFNADFYSALASATAALVLFVESLRVLRARRLELGVPPRMHVALAGVVGGGLVAAWGWGYGVHPLLALLRAAVSAASLVVAFACLAHDPVALSRGLRRLVALAVVGGPLIALGAVASEGAGGAPLVVLVTSALAMGAGVAVRVLEEPLRPASGAWLRAIRAAHAALLHEDPDDAVRGALLALRPAAGLSAPPPELWSLDPPRVGRVDAAGYLSEREARLPDSLIPMAAAEPEATLYREVLDALEVRRPDLRGLASWMHARGALLATVVAHEGTPEGLLVMPHGGREEPVTLEEVRALKGLADAMAILARTRTALARGRAHEREANARASLAEASKERALGELRVHLARGTREIVRLAGGSASVHYSKAAREALDALRAVDAVGAASSVLVVVAHPGVSALSFLAEAHLRSARAAQPFVVVDGAASREHDEARWMDPALSPVSLAGGGVVVVRDPLALPVAVQRYLAIAFSPPPRFAAGSAPPVPALILTVRDELQVNALDPLLRALVTGEAYGELGGAFVTLPRLGDRAADLRALILDALSREGLRARGTAVGIDEAALARLLTRPFAFAGEDAEVASAAERLVSAAFARGDARATVTLGDLAAAGLAAPDVDAPAEASRKPPTPPPARTRRGRPTRDRRPEKAAKPK